VQTYIEGSHPTRAKPLGTRCPSTPGGKNWWPAAYNPQLNLIYIPSSEGCNQLELRVQADFVDQGGTVKPRERFVGGAGKPMDQPTGSIKALDPVTGETKAVARTDLPSGSGVLATGGNILFSGLREGVLVAYDGRTLEELWRFDTGCGVQAPPISYAVNGKQYIAVAAGPKFQADNRPPQLKYANSCAMLYVFAL
jgi:alcohol dehydrogenase (cytochrome c)